MRIVYFANNWLGCRVVEWLRAANEEIVAAVVHPPERAKCRSELIRDTQVVLDGSQLRTEKTIDAIQSLRPDIGVSVLFGYILNEEVLSLFPRGVINLHPGLLPFNRGACPNVWSLIDGTPAGVTLHYMDAGIDTGDIIAQQEVIAEAVDTGEALYRKLMDAALALFGRTWPQIRAGKTTRVPQQTDMGTLHRMRDLASIDEIDLDRKYTGRELINIMRARTFPPHPSAWFRSGNRRIYVRVQLHETTLDD